MCGIAGIVNFKKDISNKTDILEMMVKTLKKRGPDEEGIYIFINVKSYFSNVKKIEVI